MNTISVTLFSYNELSNEAKQRVIKDIRKSLENDSSVGEFTLSEAMDSLHAITNAWGYPLADWSVGAYDTCYAITSLSSDAREVSGPRALASFLRLLIKHGYDRPKHFKEMEFRGTCGFTGVCFDDDLCETIWTALMGGSSIATAIDACSDRIGKLVEADIEYQCSDEGILEALDKHEEKYLESGEEYEHL